MKSLKSILVIALALLLIGCSTTNVEETYYEEPLPEPQPVEPVVEEELPVEPIVEEEPVETVATEYEDFEKAQGVLVSINDQTDFIIKGMYVTTATGMHEYEGVSENTVFGLEGLLNEYCLNEWFEFYIDTDYEDAIRVFVLPEEIDYSKMSVNEVAELGYNIYGAFLEYASIDKDNFGLVGGMYLNPENNTTGVYNVLFCTYDKFCYCLKLNIVPEIFEY